MDPIITAALISVAPSVIKMFSDWFGGDDKTTSRKSTQKSGSERPLDFMEPHYQRAMNYAQQLFESGVGSQVYTGQRVADLSGVTRQSISDLSRLSQHLQNPYIMGFMSKPMESIGNLRDMASGANIGKNPHFQEALQNALGTASDLVTSSISGAGRYGSGAHTGVLTNKLGQISTQAMSDQYNKDVASMLAANQIMSQAQLGQMGAIGQLGALQNQASMSALAGGGLLDRHEQAKLNAARELWQEQQMAPWQRLQNYMGAIQGLTGKFKQTGGTEDETSYAGYDPWGTVGEVAEKLGKSKFWESELFDPKKKEARLAQEKQYRMGQMAQMIRANPGVHVRR